MLHAVTQRFSKPALPGLLRLIPRAVFIPCLESFPLTTGSRTNSKCEVRQSPGCRFTCSEDLLGPAKPSNSVSVRGKRAYGDDVVQASLMDSVRA